MFLYNIVSWVHLDNRSYNSFLLLIDFDNYLVEDDDKEVSMGAGEDRNVHGYGGGVGLCSTSRQSYVHRSAAAG